MDEPQPRFWELVDEAQYAADAFDSCDVDSADPASLAALNQIVAETHARALALLNHCVEHEEALRKAFAS